MNNLLQLELLSNTIINPGENIIFDNLSLNNGDISYNYSTGVITTLSPGKYVINWWVTTQSRSELGGAVFKLITSTGRQITGTSPLKTTQSTGTGIFETVFSPTTFRLVYDGLSTLYLSDTPVKATITITQYEESMAPSYGLITSNSDATINLGQALPLTSAAYMIGMSLSNNVVTIENAGIYTIDFDFYCEPILSTVSLLINLAGGYPHSVSSDIGFLTLSIIVQLNSNSELVLVNSRSPLTPASVDLDYNTMLRIIRIA